MSNPSIQQPLLSGALQDLLTGSGVLEAAGALGAGAFGAPDGTEGEDCLFETPLPEDDLGAAAARPYRRNMTPFESVDLILMA